jgi:hypothetical protein
MMDPSLYQAGTENFNLPHDIVKLPSGGRFYKSKKSSVKVGYLTANDENVIINGITNDRDNLIINLLRNKLYEHDLRPEELLDGDVEAILIFLRNTSFGPEYDINLEDPSTGKKFQTTIILDELNIKQPKVQPNDDGMFILTLPKSSSTVKIKLLTLGDNTEISNLEKTYPKGRVTPTITWRLNKQILEVDGNSDRLFISKFIDTLPIADSKYIRNFVRDNQPSLDLKKEVLAPSGEIVTANVTFGVEFFRPFF